ncbi:MAG: hypothetical protein U5K00_17900 [Melioribacteraceae bacterium]|nr:hypothetical protein [Melioribacteraceae bacterium]
MILTIGDTSEPFVLYPVEDEILENNELTYIFSNDGGNINGRLSLGFTDTYGSLVYKEGLLFGGLVNNEIRVTGTAFFNSMMPGRSNQTFSDAREFRIWNFRTDWQQLPEGKEKEELK